MILRFNHFYDVLEKMRCFFSSFLVILVGKPMKMAKTEFRGFSIAAGQKGTMFY